MFWFATEQKDEKISVMWAILIVAIYPLVLFKDIDKLWITSFLACVSVAYIFGFLIVLLILSKIGKVDLPIPPPAVAFNTNPL